VKTVDVRVVAATNADLKTAIHAGTFRQDLFYRLNVIRIELPPLRDRGDDVLLLAQHFIQKHAKEVGRPAPRLQADAALCLQRYAWPGNIRELEHAIEHAVVLYQAEALTAAALPAEVREGAKEARLPSPDRDQAVPVSAAERTPSLPQEAGDLCYTEAKKQALAHFNESYIRALMASTGGNLSEAARRSGLDRSNFRRLVRTTLGRTPKDE
jgi:DNA-binding NtrC family response regulator